MTVNVPDVPSVNVVVFALVIAGAWFTVSVKFCVALGATPLAAVIVIGYVPPLPGAGVPARDPAAVSVTPAGNDPVSLNVAAGVPVAVTVNVPAVPAAKLALLALVMAGAPFTTMVKFCIALGNTPLPAVNVRP
jgi:hypothetical protein